MLHTLSVIAGRTFVFKDFLKYLDLAIQVDAEERGEDGVCYYFHREKESTTLYAIVDEGKGELSLCMDGLASYADYKFFPYLADCLHQFLNRSPLTVDGQPVFDFCNEEWMAEAIGEEIAGLKSVLSIAPRYYLTLPFRPYSYVSKEMLAEYGVSLHSSTPRIYGYIQFLMKQHRIKEATEEELASDRQLEDQEFTVDVPQHVSIGRVKSWQLDGAETWESFAEEDIRMLLELGEGFRHGKKVEGVVLNDLGTLFQEGIGVAQDGDRAAYWFREAIRLGERWYAPSNLGDLYRKGCGALAPSLTEAFKAYCVSEDPYAHYRIGQAYEEGWTGAPDMDKAMEWYRRAADERHHLAVRRLKQAQA